MTVSLWRMATETRACTADDLSGTGARLSGGRWNSQGVPMVYSASSVSLALLETVYALRNGDLPMNRYLVRIDVPDDVFACHERCDPPPGGWDAIPAGITSAEYGDGWIAGAGAALLQVPSVIVPDESNHLINPRHRDSVLMQAMTVRRWQFDPRLFK